MRSKRIVFLAFLLMLYIGPSLFAMSSIHTATPTEPNMNKEFVISADWWNETFYYRNSVSCGGGYDDSGFNYTVRIDVTYDAHMQADFDDIRFTDNDNSTPLNYWRESYISSTSAVFWVKVADELDGNSGGTVYMYYGNADVSTTSNGTNTFSFFDDFENNDLDRWSQSDSDWSTQSSVVKMGTYSAYGDSTGSRLLMSDANNFTTDFMVHTWIRVTSSVQPRYRYGTHGYWNGTNVSGFIIYNDDWMWWNGGVNVFEANTVVADTWYRMETAFSFTDDEVSYWRDGVFVATRDFDNYNQDNVEWMERIGCMTDGAVLSLYDQYQDDYYVRKWVADEPVFDSFGAKEYLYPPDWKIINEVDLIFYVPVDFWAFDMFLIFFGLVLVIASGCYLAYSLKNNMTQDKLFYFLIAFMLGWGLFLGGMLL